MKLRSRRPVVACAAFATTLVPVVLACAAGAAVAAPAHQPAVAAHPAHAHPAVGHASRRALAPRQSALDAATGTITLHVYDFLGQPAVGADVFWSNGPDGNLGDSGTVVNADGSYLFSGVPAVAGDGQIGAILPAGAALTYTNQSWPAEGTDVGIQPGHLPLTVMRGGPWYDATDPSYDFNELDAQVTGSSGGVVTDRTADQALANLDQTADVTTDLDVMAATYAAGTLNFWFPYGWSDEGAEIPGSHTVVGAGSTSSDPIAVQETDAARLYLNAGHWWSGKPGTRVSLGLQNYGIDWPVYLVGYSEFGVIEYEFGGVTVTSQSQTVTGLSVRGAMAGYWYFFGTLHSPDGLYLESPFQVCTLKSSVAKARRGVPFRLSGVVPVQGHTPGHAGVAKSVTLYKRFTAAGQPSKLTPSRPWIRVKSVKTDRYGRYSFRGLIERRATWYVVRYAMSDTWYWPAFTSVLKVSVK